MQTNYHLKQIVLARLYINVKAVAVPADFLRDSKCSGSVILHVILYLEVVNTLEVLQITPSFSHSVQNKCQLRNGMK